jgi:hypothetical protein
MLRFVSSVPRAQQIIQWNLASGCSRRLFLHHKKQEIIMNRKVKSLLLIGVMGCAVGSFAQGDPPNAASNDASHRQAMNWSDMTPLERKAMKECMVKEMKISDDDMTMGEMRKSCQAQVRMRLPKDEAKLAAPPTSTAKP